MTIDHDRMRQVADAYAAAWNSGSAEAVARFHAPDGGIVINRGRLWEGRTGLAEMAAGFFADVPDLALVCDGLRIAGDHVAYLWTFTGTAATTGNALRIPGWESGTSTRSTWSGRPEAGSTRLTTRARSGDHPHRADRRTAAASRRSRPAAERPSRDWSSSRSGSQRDCCQPIASR
jgi:uncharacterized protein (TIGR02246 family)